MPNSQNFTEFSFILFLKNVPENTTFPKASDKGLYVKSLICDFIGTKLLIWKQCQDQDPRAASLMANTSTENRDSKQRTDVEDIYKEEKRLFCFCS